MKHSRDGGAHPSSHLPLAYDNSDEAISNDVAADLAGARGSSLKEGPASAYVITEVNGALPEVMLDLLLERFRIIGVAQGPDIEEVIIGFPPRVHDKIGAVKPGSRCGIAVPPDLPQPVNLGMMQPEHWIRGRCAGIIHDAANPAVAVIMRRQFGAIRTQTPAFNTVGKFRVVAFSLAAAYSELKIY